MASRGKYLRIMVRFALAALLVLGVFLLRRYTVEALEWYGVGRGYATFLGLVAIATLLFRFSPPGTKVSETEGRVVWGILAGACGLLFTLFYLHDIVYNPLVLFGEWRSSSATSVRIWEKLSSGSLLPPPGYNLGMGYLYLPLYALVGESVCAVKGLYLACWTLAVGTLTAVWWRQYRYEGALSILLVVSTLAYGLAALRDYKWHAVAALLTATLFWVMSRIERKKGIGGYLLLACMLAAGIVCYHACIAYVVFAALYLLLGRESRPGGKCGIWMGGRGVGLLALIAVAAAAAWMCRGFFSHRLADQLRWTFAGGLGSWNTKFHLVTFLSLFFEKTSPVASLALVIGLGAGIADFRREWIARFSTTGFLVIGLAVMITFPFTDISHANCIIMFVFLVMAYGIYSVLTRIPWVMARQIAIVLLAWCLARQEYALYETHFWNNGCQKLYPENYNMQGVVALYDLRMSETPSKGVIFFPGRGVEAAAGGFGWWIHDDVFAMREYSPWGCTLRYFRSLEGLRRGVESLMAARAGTCSPIKAYISTAVGRKSLDEALRGLSYQCNEITYFEREWRSRIPVYKLVIYSADGGATE